MKFWWIFSGIKCKFPFLFSVFFDFVSKFHKKKYILIKMDEKMELSIEMEEEIVSDILRNNITDGPLVVLPSIKQFYQKYFPEIFTRINLNRSWSKDSKLFQNKVRTSVIKDHFLKKNIQTTTHPRLELISTSRGVDGPLWTYDKNLFLQLRSHAFTCIGPVNLFGPVPGSRRKPRYFVKVHPYPAGSRPSRGIPYI